MLARDPLQAPPGERSELSGGPAAFGCKTPFAHNLKPLRHADSERLRAIPKYLCQTEVAIQISRAINLLPPQK
mgnify:FL=1